jgi:hypothetical protein
LIYHLQVFHDLNLKPNYALIAIMLQNQAMDLYDQPNVKGWQGGSNWLTSQIYTDRAEFIDFVVSGNENREKDLNRRLKRFDAEPISFNPSVVLKNRKNAKSILKELSDNTIFSASEDMRAELSQLLNYDFDPKSENADKRILKVYQYLSKSPEFQII